VEKKKDILWRVYLGFIGLGILSLCVFGKAVYIQTANGDELKELSKKKYTYTEEIDAERGTIYSEDGKMLCTSIPIYDVRIDFLAEGLRAKNSQVFKDKLDSLGMALANLFNDKTTEEYKSELQQGFNNGDRYYLLKKGISYEEYNKIRKFPLVKLGKNKSGFMFDEYNRRLNPYQMLGFRTIGLVKKDSNYNVGLERYYDTILRGSIGSRVMKKVSGNTSIPIDGLDIEPEKGKDLITTLDVVIQDIAETALYKKLVKQDAEYGTCIVMEVATGKIKAIANLGRMDNGKYWENYNYALEAYEPGSTIKLASIMALMEDGFADLNTPVNLNGGVWQYGASTMNDAERHGKFQSTLLEAFEESSNVGISYLVNKNYSSNPNKFIAYLNKLNFNTTTGIDLVGERNPKIPKPNSGTWSTSSLPWMSVGYELQVNPLQVLCLYNAVANNGTYMKPYLVNAIKDFGKTITQYNPTVVTQNICSPATLQKVKRCLEGVVEVGTAKKLKSNVYKIAGKTGTALFSGKGVTYKDKVYVSSFAGYFPANNPQYSCIVVIKNKTNASSYVGAEVAGPVFKEIADRLYGLKVVMQNTGAKNSVDSANFNSALFSDDAKRLAKMFGLPYSDSIVSNQWALWQQQNGKVNLKGYSNKNNIMPNLLGLGLRDAIYIAENKGIKILHTGSGKVKSQSIAAGTVITNGEKINIELQ
jgi:cell division protein FtsI (penicillin-binding protein 3)